MLQEEPPEAPITKGSSASTRGSQKRSGGRELLWLILASILSTTIGYQINRPIAVPVGRAFWSTPFVEGFHDAEGDYRWSRSRSCVTFPDIGPGRRGKVALDIAGFRPRGQKNPLVVLETPGSTQQFEARRRIESLQIPAASRGWWSSDIRVCLRSETFTPGPTDERSLGVRVHEARWLPRGSALVWGFPSLRQVVLASLTLCLFFGTLVRVGLRPSSASRSGLIGACLMGGAYAWARGYMASAVIPLLLLTFVAFAVTKLFPSLVDLVRQLFLATGMAARQGLDSVTRWTTLVIAIAGFSGLSIAYLARPELDIDLGSGQETTLVDRFASFDAERGVTFRRALAGSQIDLRDFGGGTNWQITITASLDENNAAVLPLARAGYSEVEAALGDTWTETRLVAPAPVGWRSGLRIEFPAATNAGRLRIDRVVIQRGRALPSLRTVLAFLGATLVFLWGLGATGLPARWCTAGTAFFLGAVLYALFFNPVLFIPFAGTLLGICLLASIGALLGGGLLHLDSASSSDFHARSLALAVIQVGFIVWLTAMAFPLYKGLHFLYHSSIAEEIWKGKFLVFYLPHPDNILSREAQWGGLVVPYPCTYHTLIAPLTALPASWFAFLQKLLQVSMLTCMAFLAAALARRFGNARAGVWAALLTVTMTATYQLLALSHFLTVFGCWAASLALAFVIFYLDRLGLRTYWWGAVALLTLAYLSYTASLLFTVFTLALALPFVFRKNPQSGRHLAGCTSASLAAAFFIYYIHWVMPFLRESIPILLVSGGDEPFSIWARLSMVPRKLAYSFGTSLIPLVGLASLAGLGVRSRVDARFILLAWASILIVFSFFDVFFNFILKHHYFVMVPVAVGGGLLVDRAMTYRFWAKLPAVAFLLVAVLLGARAAFALAMGTLQ